MMDKSELTQSVTPGKKPYAKPQVVYQQPLEAMASVCTPSPPGKASTFVGCVDGSLTS
jgi:hypothetical protein